MLDEIILILGVEWTVKARCISANVIVLKRSDVLGEPTHHNQLKTMTLDDFETLKGDDSE